MSGKPHREGAFEIIRAARRLGELAVRIPHLRREADAAKQALDDATTEQTHIKRTLAELLNSMDCSSTGNFGWEGRVGWLLGEVIRQLDAERGVKQ